MKKVLLLTALLCASASVLGAHLTIRNVSKCPLISISTDLVGGFTEVEEREEKKLRVFNPAGWRIVCKEGLMRSVDYHKDSADGEFNTINVW